MKNKGIFYSIVTLLFLVPLILYATTYLDITSAQLEYKKTKITGEKLSAYVESINSDLPRALEIIGKQSVAAAIAQIDYSGTPLDDANNRIIEVMMNGTIYSRPTNLTNSTLPSWVNAAIFKGVRYGFETNITIKNLSVNAYDSFHVLLRATIIVNSTESSRTMRLDKTYNEDLVLSIEGFEDTIYTLNTNGLLTRTIKKANITVSGATAVDTAVAQKLYMSSNDGPSFLDRLEGRLSTSSKYSSQTPNIIGLETLIYLPEISYVGVPIKTSQSVIDHYYFGSSAHAGSLVEDSSYDWLRLDASHAAFYGVTLV